MAKGERLACGESSAGARKMLVCIECGQGVSSVYREFPVGSGHIRLSCCDKCGAVADPYVQRDALLISIDLLLHKPQVYRHLLFNSDRPLLRQEPQQAFKFALACVFFDSYLKWISLVNPRSQERRPDPQDSFLEKGEECVFPSARAPFQVPEEGGGKEDLSSVHASVVKPSLAWRRRRIRRSGVSRISVAVSATAFCGFTLYLLLGSLGCLRALSNLNSSHVSPLSSRPSLQNGEKKLLFEEVRTAQPVSLGRRRDTPPRELGRKSQEEKSRAREREKREDSTSVPSPTAPLDEQLTVLAAVAVEFLAFSFSSVLLTRLVLLYRHLTCCKQCASVPLTRAALTAQQAMQKLRRRLSGAFGLERDRSMGGDVSTGKESVHACSSSSKEGRRSQLECSGCYSSSCKCTRGICCHCCVAKFGWRRIFHAMLLSMYGKTGTLLLLAWSEASLLGAYLGMLVLSSNAAALNILLQSRRGGPAVVAVAASVRAIVRLSLLPLLPHRIHEATKTVTSLSDWIERAVDLVV